MHNRPSRLVQTAVASSATTRPPAPTHLLLHLLLLGLKAAAVRLVLCAGRLPQPAALRLDGCLQQAGAGAGQWAVRRQPCASTGSWSCPQSVARQRAPAGARGGGPSPEPGWRPPTAPTHRELRQLQLRLVHQRAQVLRLLGALHLLQLQAVHQLRLQAGSGRGCG
jgi:hypothetical protein